MASVRKQWTRGACANGKSVVRGRRERTEIVSQRTSFARVQSIVNTTDGRQGGPESSRERSKGFTDAEGSKQPNLGTAIVVYLTCFGE